MATADVSTEESADTHPAELGAWEGVKIYGRRVVTTAVGRWLVVVFMLMGALPGGTGATEVHSALQVAVAFASAFLVLFAVDFARAEYRRAQEADDA